jgi:beta-1,4-mannosyl-glycoprotein beta-1,4-N-acetylglucosaminyltransferase
MYSDENMLLDIRLNILNNIVDKFVITEAKYTHDGSLKKLNFDINKYQMFKNKINYIVVENESPEIRPINKEDNNTTIADKKIKNSIKRDHYQREQLSIGIAEADDEDLIIISDLDEIPNLSEIKFNNINNEILFFKQKMFYYKLNLHYDGYCWYGTKAVKKKNFISPQWLRNLKSKKYPFWRFDTFVSKKKYMNIKFVDNGGWHFTCIKKPEEIEKKLLSFAHHYDYEQAGLSLEDLKRKIKEKYVLYDHHLDKSVSNKWNSTKKLSKIDINEMPEFIKINKNLYKDWLED